MLTSALTMPDLRRLFLGIARITAASSCMAACATEHGEGDRGERDGGSPQEWTPVPCSTDGTAEPDSELHVASSVDHVGVYSDQSHPDTAPTRHVTERARVGSLCEGVSDRAPCQAVVDSLKADRPECPDSDCRFALIGVGSSYTRVDQREQMIDTFGSIDTVAEAVLLAAFDGHVVCSGLGGDERTMGLEIRAAGEGGYDLRSTWEDCGEGVFQELFSIAPDGAATQVSMTKLAPSLCTIGRRAPGVCEAAPSAYATRAGAYLSEAARLEAGSVHAFHRLIRELGAHGAPDWLRALALDAMLDEVRHACEVGELARAYGGEASAPQVADMPLRSLRELALDNAHEGCVRETFGALLATYQAETAEDGRVRLLMARIAEDETRHAELSWQLMAWLLPRLSDTERAEVSAVQERALVQLASEAEPPVDEHERRALGLPSADACRALLAGMRRGLAEALAA